MWIKEKSEDGSKIYIINAKTYKINNLENLEIIELDKNYKLLNTIISKKANIDKKNWILRNVKVYSDKKMTEDFEIYQYNSSFNGEIISNLFSNLNSLNIFQLIELKENYNSIGYSATEVRLHLNKIYSTPFYLTLTSIIGALLMFKLNFINSKFFLVVLYNCSVIFYHYYFSILFGKMRLYL